ncbi:MAG: hypothetical protein IPP76_13895 [Moraxellaceae bacterium]|nr:hypothetical protein [Moraxellaceae bacterium]
MQCNLIWSLTPSMAQSRFINHDLRIAPQLVRFVNIKPLNNTCEASL